ncbi:MAG: hypothetical protein PHC91_06400, partial [Eubacteriales bacterium]|nr:hypothetical protein [Eubacteriales bacterium]
MKRVGTCKFNKDRRPLNRKVDQVERIEDVKNTGSADKIIHLGIIGSREAEAQFLKESKNIRGIEVVGVFDPETVDWGNDFEEFLKTSSAVYIESSALSMAETLRYILRHNKNVLFEAEKGLDPEALRALYDEAEENSLVLLEAVKTAYCP